MIRELLENKTASEKANIKGQEIAKIDFRGEYTSQEYGVRIDIQSISAIEGGVEVFARAWRGAKQLGFGKDGSVDIERFNIYNPPIMVNDPSGDVKYDWASPSNAPSPQRGLREDAAEAVRQSISHTIKLTGKEDTQIVKDKRGNTVSTFYPSPTASTSPVDGFVVATDVVWATVHAASTGTADDTSATVDEPEASTGFTLSRTFTLYDTAAIDDTDTIDSVVHSLYTFSLATNEDTSTLDSIETSPASTDNLVAGDFDLVTLTSLGNVALADVPAGGYNDITLSATGEAAINKTGVTKLGFALGLDISNTTPTGANRLGNAGMAERTGTANDPKLVVTHSAAAASTTPLQMLMGVGT